MIRASARRSVALFLLLIFVSSTFSLPVSLVIAQEAIGVTTGNLNVRAAPSANAARVGQMPQGTEFVVEGRNSEGTWLYGATRDGSLRGWVSAQYLDKNFDVAALPVLEQPATTSQSNDSSSATQNENTQSTAPDGVPTATTRTRLNMRSGPSTRNAIVTRLAPRTVIVIEGRSVDGNWVYGYTFNDGVRGWVSLAYVTRNFDVASMPVIEGAASTSTGQASTQSQSSNTRGDPAAVVAAFMRARVDSNAGTLRSLSCTAFRGQAAAMADSFRSMDAELEGMACFLDGIQDGVATVHCTGRIVTTYNGQTREWPIGSYRLIEEGGSWKVCGEAG